MKLRHLARGLGTLAVAALLAAPAYAGTVGTSQSPIDIITADAVRADLPALQFNYATSTNLSLGVATNSISNDIHEAVLKATPTTGGSLTIGSTVCSLLQFHFHTPAEHEMDGVLAPMELHFVNQATDGSLAVVGVFIKEGAANPVLSQLLDTLPSIGNPVAVTSFDIMALLPDVLTSYRYSGSLTTAPYSEPVAWNVLANTTLTATAEQIAAVSALFDGHNNREVQELNGRIVLTDVPEPATLALLLSAGLGLVVLRRRDC